MEKAIIRIKRISPFFLIAFVLSCIIYLTSASSHDVDEHYHHNKAEPLKLRRSYSNLSVSDVQATPNISIRKNEKWGFYGYSTIGHDYELIEIDGDKVVNDHATGLMWHQSGSTYGMNWEKANHWIEQLNKKGYAGYHDWRLPTVEEAASLLEPSNEHSYIQRKDHVHNEECYKQLHCEYDVLCRCGAIKQSPVIDDDPASAKQLNVHKHNEECNRLLQCEAEELSKIVVSNRYIDPVFDKTQGWIWTGDNYRRLDAAWRVDYFMGLVDWDIYYYVFYHIRPVRGIHPDTH